MKTPKWKKEKEIYDGNKSIVYTLDLKNKLGSPTISIFLNELPNIQDTKKTKTEVEIIFWADCDSDAKPIFTKKFIGKIETVDKQYIVGIQERAMVLVADYFLKIAENICRMLTTKKSKK